MLGSTKPQAQGQEPRSLALLSRNSLSGKVDRWEKACFQRSALRSWWGEAASRTQTGQRPSWEWGRLSLGLGACDQGVKVGHVPCAGAALPPPPILTLLCVRQSSAGALAGGGSKDLQHGLEALGMPGRLLPHVPPIWALSLLGALKWECHLREGHGG